MNCLATTYKIVYRTIYCRTVALDQDVQASGYYWYSNGLGDTSCALAAAMRGTGYSTWSHLWSLPASENTRSMRPLWKVEMQVFICHWWHPNDESYECWVRIPIRLKRRSWKRCRRDLGFSMSSWTSTEMALPFFSLLWKPLTLQEGWVHILRSSLQIKATEDLTAANLWSHSIVSSALDRRHRSSTKWSETQLQATRHVFQTLPLGIFH